MAYGIDVELRNLTKRYGSFAAIDDISLRVPSGSFATLLGPSGSGKTTTLNAIAGFVTPDEGEIRFNDQAVSQIPTYKRNIGMVFQSYALFPHLTVGDNVAYPLKMRDRMSRAAVAERVRECLAMVRLEGYETRLPKQLSGGQQQRVAMARALASRPRLLLMDEPLGALDRRLRDQVQIEIKEIQRQTGATFIYVTHDQTEAFVMSDLVVVMNDSRISQVGTPTQIYDEPDNVFVANFLGGSNLIPATVEGVDASDYLVALGDGTRLAVPRRGQSMNVGEAAYIFIRPEDITVGAPTGAQERTVDVAATVETVDFHGDSLRITARIKNTSDVISIRTGRHQPVGGGADIGVSWKVDVSRLLKR
ncbi:ABC transporter ATP-binding protein [Acuticoccus mangrovi]|uniref:ABC transporter ATP-binding protein n=1 Tax=Acuticoccus mangrovi TaxID=2796142 RepID=A0A934MJ40_9HYPH|nr:ABC transporter ATP-binding protein [Acuticoccus mangrovi]MBJ3777866.1 ABC transporter ATP-binding protein [Acuticoccus mangrovi]